jgi:DNA-binding SARP family transcriptional activator
MDFRILGPIEAIEGDGPLPLGGAKQRALLGMLLLHANEVVSSDLLIDELWGGERREDALRALQVAVSRLRKSLEPARPAGAQDGLVITRSPGYELRIDPERLDATRFEALVDEGRRALARGDPAMARTKLDEALGLWRGPPLADLAYESFCQTEITRLQEARIAALENRIDADLHLGRHSELVGELRALVRDEPLRERLRGQLMLALYRSGRQAEALDAYAEARGTLVEQLGLEPGAELRELHRAILQQDPRIDPVAAPDPTVATPRGTFVGRERELSALVGALDDAFAGRGRLALLVGEPGIGKSRLAEELIAHARARGARVLIGRCWEAGGAPAYWPWVQSLRTYVRETDASVLHSWLGDGAADLVQILPGLREKFPDLPDRPVPESEGARFRLFDAVAELVRAASRDQPTVLVLDDLHAADAPSLLLLRFFARQLAASRVLLLGAYRDVDPIPGGPLTEMLAEVAREPVTQRLALGGLSEDEVAEYVELTAADSASAELVAALADQTDGNPLFVGEIVRLLAVEGAAPGSTAEVRLEIPQSVRDVIARRLTHLSEECNRVLSLASVLGREFVLDALGRMADVSDDELLETLDEAMRARVVVDVPGVRGRLRFAHVLIRDTLYEGLTTARRVQLHRLALDLLEALYGDEREPHLAELGHHAVAGSDFDKGLSYTRRAGDRALGLLAYEEAARLYEAALEALQLANTGDEGTRCALLLSLGEAELCAGKVQPSKRAFLEAADIARRLRYGRDLARAAAGYGGRFMWARAAGDERLVPLLEEGLAALSDEDVELRARLLARLAGVHRDDPSRDSRDRLSREAVELARRAGNPAALAYALDGRAAAISAPDTVGECLALATELLEVAERIGDQERKANALDHRRTARVIAGDLRQAAADLEEEIHIAEDLRQAMQQWQVCSTRAMFALVTGRLEDAERLILEALEYGQPVQPAAAIPVFRLQLYTLRDFQGRLEEVLPAIRDSVHEYPTRPIFRCALAHIQARSGQGPDAKRTLGQLARDEFESVPFDQEWLYSMSLLAETATLLSEEGAAEILYRLLLPWSALNAGDHPEGIRGSVFRYLGMLATTMGRVADAERHFEDAIVMNERMDAHPWLARTQRDYSQMLRGRDNPGDAERAQELSDAAEAIYRELEMV